MWGLVSSAWNGVKTLVGAVKECINKTGSWISEQLNSIGKVVWKVMIPGFTIAGGLAGGFHLLVSFIAATAKGALLLGSLVAFVAAYTGIQLVLPFITGGLGVFILFLATYFLTINLAESRANARNDNLIAAQNAREAEHARELETTIAIAQSKDALVLTVRGENAEVRKKLEELEKAHQHMNAQNAREMLALVCKDKQNEEQIQTLSSEVVQLKKALGEVISLITTLTSQSGATINPTTFIISLSSAGISAADTSAAVSTFAGPAAANDTVLSQESIQNDSDEVDETAPLLDVGAGAGASAAASSTLRQRKPAYKKP